MTVDTRYTPCARVVAMSPTPLDPAASLRYPPEPPEPSGRHAVAVVWDWHGGVQLTTRATKSMLWAVTGDYQLFYWDELMHKIALHAENPQATLDSVRVVDIPASSKPAVPIEPPWTGKAVVAQFGGWVALRMPFETLWDVTGRAEAYTWKELMAYVDSTTGFAAWKVLN